jgi:hypothetical protein
VKALTRTQLQSRKEKAVRFTRDVLGDPERADEIADESLEVAPEDEGDDGDQNGADDYDEEDDDQD